MRIMAHEMMEKISRTSRTNLTTTPALTTMSKILALKFPPRFIATIGEASFTFNLP
ncbi:MAG: hypothetical protein ACD_87C00236G0001 [uncultured bacterium]|nr:MAG: hypothetical protein ACD_87C00236G0001 [uncultured bacterium]